MPPSQPRRSPLPPAILLLLILSAAALSASDAVQGPPAATQPIVEVSGRLPVRPYLNMPRLPPKPAGGWEVVNAFPNLLFEDPVCMAFAPHDPDWFYVGGRQGHVWKFRNDPLASIKTLVLDLSTQTQGWVESGLLGLAFPTAAICMSGTATAKSRTRVPARSREPGPRATA